MTLQPELLFAATYRFLWGDTSNTPPLTGISPYICLITKMYSLITNKGEIVSQLIEGNKMENE